MIAFALTHHVKHLTAWTRDHPEAGRSWASGWYRPICGERLRSAVDTYFPDVDYEDPRYARRAARLPLCKRCVKVLAELVESAGYPPLGDCLTCGNRGFIYAPCAGCGRQRKIAPGLLAPDEGWASDADEVTP